MHQGEHDATAPDRSCPTRCSAIVTAWRISVSQARGQEPSAATGQRMTASIAFFSALGWLGRRGAVLRSSTISAPIS
jgi:hypothetical protein